MIDVRPGETSLADYIVDFPGLRIGIREMSLLGDEVYLWAELTGSPSRGVLRKAKMMFDGFTGRSVVNVSALDRTAVRFAEFFGFRSVSQQNDILIMEKL